MASLIDTLIDVLGQEDAEYKKLLELSNNKTKAIVGADIERLQDILVQEQARIDAINKLEQQRMENVDTHIQIIKITLINKSDTLHLSIFAESSTNIIHIRIQFILRNIKSRRIYVDPFKVYQVGCQLKQCIHIL